MKTKILILAAASLIALSTVASADSSNSFRADAPFYNGSSDAPAHHAVKRAAVKKHHRPRHTHKAAMTEKAPVKAEKKMDEHKAKKKAK